MNRALESTTRALRAVWRHASAIVAVVLIAGALVIGIRIGTANAPAPAAPSATTDAGAGPTMYTCSMHPQVRLPDPDAKCPICFMDLIPVADLAGATDRQLTIPAASAALADIETSVVQRRFPEAEVRLFGRIGVDETRVARLTAYFPGRLERLFVNYKGVPVRKGDHIADIYSPDLIAAFAEIHQARLAIDAKAPEQTIFQRINEETLASAREKLRLYGLTPEQIDAAERGEMGDEPFTIYAPIGGIVTHLGAREGDYVQTGSPIATVADLSRLWLDLEAYESQLPMLRWGQAVTFTVEAHPGEVFDGRISYIEPMVDERMRTAAVRVAVDNTDSRLKPGMFASAVVTTRVDDRGAVLGDELAGAWVSPMHPTIVKDAPGTCDICGMDLVPAETLNAVGDDATDTPPLVVPRSAVLVTGRRSIVYVRVPGEEAPTFEARQVTLGPRAGDAYIIVDGLREGEEVVTSGAFRVDSAMQIAAKPSMMSGPTGAHDDAGRASPAPPPAPAPPGFAAALTPVYDAYLDAQEALADDDLDAFRAAGVRLEAAIVGVNDAPLGRPAREAWRSAATRLHPEPDPDIEVARATFERMSEAVIALERTFGHAGDAPLRLAFCPMAFDFKGAEWIQRSDQIDNPYFGEQMLRCGEIRETFEPRDAGAHDHGEENGDG